MFTSKSNSKVILTLTGLEDRTTPAGLPNPYVPPSPPIVPVVVVIVPIIVPPIPRVNCSADWLAGPVQNG